MSNVPRRPHLFLPQQWMDRPILHRSWLSQQSFGHVTRIIGRLDEYLVWHCQLALARFPSRLIFGTHYHGFCLYRVVSFVIHSRCDISFAPTLVQIKEEHSHLILQISSHSKISCREAPLPQLCSGHFNLACNTCRFESWINFHVPSIVPALQLG